MHVFVFLLTIAKFASSANILAHFITPATSHQSVYRNIWKELSLRGHKVTVITPNPLKDSRLVNLTEIDVGFSYRVIIKEARAGKLSQEEKINARRLLKELLPLIFDSQLEEPDVKKIYSGQNDQKYDLVLVEMIYPVVYALAHKYNCPYVGIASLSGTKVLEIGVGNPSHPVAYPDIMLEYGEVTTFFQRLHSTFYDIQTYIGYNWELMPAMDKKAREIFGNDIPYLGDIEHNVSMVLQSANFITVKPKPTVPTLIELPSTHITKNTTLPKDLKKELDDATQGVIYFSLGSNVKSVNLTSRLKNVIVSALSELPYKVIWKWESDHFPGKPDNVVIRQWLPQEGVLAHPNVRMFITQGGLQSMEEALFYKVPLLGMPFFGDQPSNVNKMVQMGIGLDVNRNTVTKEELKLKILEIINNNKYRQKISEVAEIAFDQPMTGVEKAVWWIEYVIRHKGAKHLRNPLLDMPLYQYLFLDIIALVLGVVSITMCVLVFSIKYLLRFIKSSQKSTKIKSS